MWEHYSSMFNKYYNIAKNYQTANLNNKCTKNHRVNSNSFLNHCTYIAKNK